MTDNSRTNWRELFSGEFQEALVCSALQAYKTSFEWLLRESLVTPSETERMLALLENARNRDISITYKLYKTRFEWIGGESARDLRGTLQAIFFGLRDNPAASARLYEVENLMRKITECELILALLKEARNVFAHTTKDTRSSAWDEMLKASTLYLLEITGFADKYSELALKLTSPLSSTEDGRAEAPESISGKREVPEDQLASVSAQLDKITDLLKSHQPEVKEFDGSSKVVIAEAELESSLQAWREEVAQKFSGPSWPGPGANIFQRSIIADIMKWQPNSVEEVLRLPDVAWRYEKNKPQMKAQLDSYRDRLSYLLENVQWEVSDDY